ncbi:MAG: T9SS type A sorting domain-containing protein [Bacteroidales bacterium]|nr:T9SS type A sorting domain-containing protein [Bacteroidales bacterium]
MRRLIPNILSIILIVGISATGYAQSSFEIVLESYGESICSVAALVETSDGNYMGKYTRQQYTDTLDTWYEYLIKISPEGDTSTILFQKEDTILFFTRIIQVNENPMQYFVSGMNYPRGQAAWKNEFFMLLDENFGIIWEKQYKLSGMVSGFASRDIMQLADGSFLYARRPGINAYMYLFHLSANGDSLKFRSYEGDSAGQVMALTYSPDSSAYWLHTRLAHYDPTGPESQVIVLNEELEQTKVMYYPRWFSENYYAKVLPENRLVAAGRFFDFESSYLATYIVDTGLNVIYEDCLTDPDTNIAAIGKCVDYYYPDQIFAGGTHNSGAVWGNQPTWFIIAKYNQELELIYERYIGGDANYWLYGIAATSDSGIIFSGTRYDYWEPVTKKKAIIIKLNPDGLLVGDEEVQAGIKVSKAIVYPNPGTAKLMVRTALKNCIIRLFDMKGTEVMAKLIDKHITEINTRNLKPGTYIFVIEQNNTVIETGKWIKQ